MNRGKINITAAESRCKKPQQISEICKRTNAKSWEDNEAEVLLEDFEYVLKIFGLI